MLQYAYIVIYTFFISIFRYTGILSLPNYKYHKGGNTYK